MVPLNDGGFATLVAPLVPSTWASVSLSAAFVTSASAGCLSLVSCLEDDVHDAAMKARSIRMVKCFFIIVLSFYFRWLMLLIRNCHSV